MTSGPFWHFSAKVVPDLWPCTAWSFDLQGEGVIVLLAELPLQRMVAFKMPYDADAGTSARMLDDTPRKTVLFTLE